MRIRFTIDVEVNPDQWCTATGRDLTRARDVVDDIHRYLQPAFLAPQVGVLWPLLVDADATIDLRRGGSR